METSTLDAAPHITKLAPHTNIEGPNGATLEVDTKATNFATFGTSSASIILANLRSNLHNRIQVMEDLLGTMATPIRNPIQEFEYNKCINRICKLLTEANATLLGIKLEHREDIKASELAALGTSLTTIEQEMAIADNALCD